MSCDGIQALNPLCVASQALSNTTGSLADSALSHMAGFFGLSALSATDSMWQQISDVTTLDLGSASLRQEMALVGGIAVILCFALFLIQVITAAIRGRALALGRAVTGLGVSFIGSALALATTRTLLGVVDELSAGLVQTTMGTNIEGVGKKLTFVQLTSLTNPVTVLLLSCVIIASVVVIWASMMVRKVVIIVAAVLAPLAFAGATADITRAWVRRWIELVAAMVFAKLLLVIILSIGVNVLNGAGQAGDGVGQTGTQIAGGTLLLLLGGLSPWVAVKFFHFAGDTLYAAHATAGHATAGGRAVIAAPAKINQIRGTARAFTPSLPSRTGSSGQAAMTAPHTSPPPLAPAGSSAVGSSAGAAASGGAAAATAAAVPVAIVAAGAAAVHAASGAAQSAVVQATSTAPSPFVASPLRFPPDRRGIDNEDRDAREAEEVRPGVP